MVLFPLLLCTGIGLALLLWPAQNGNSSPMVIPPSVAAGPPVPQNITSLAQGQFVGDEARFKGFRLNFGWSLAETADYGRFTLLADVTNEMDVADVARVLVKIRVANQDVEVLMCRVTLNPGETKPLICADTGHASYTSRWSRLTLSTV